MIPRDDSGGELMLPPIAPRAQLPSAYIPNESEDPSRGPIRLLWRRRWSVVAVVGICLLGAWIYLRETPLAFVSEARVYVQEKGPALVADQPGAVTNSDSFLYLQGETIKSSLILQHVADTEALKSLPTLKGAADPVRTLRNQLAVEVDNHLSVIDLKYTASNPRDAVAIVNVIADTFVDSRVKPEEFGTNLVLKILQEGEKTQQKLLDNALDEAAKFQTANGSISFADEKGNIVVQDLAKLSNAYTEAQVQEIVARTNLAQAKALEGHRELWTQMAANPIGNDPSVALAGNISNTLSELKIRAAALRAGYGENNPAVKSLETMIGEYQRSLDATNENIAQNYIRELQQQYDNALRNMNNFKAEVDVTQQKALKLNDLQTQYAILKNNVDRETRLRDQITNRLQATNLNQSGATLNIQILQLGDPQSLDIEPRPHKVLGMAGVMGVTLGMVCAFLQDMLDRRIRSADEVRARLRKRVLGAIPHVRGSHSIAGLGRQVDLDPASDASEAFRIVSTSIHLGMPSRRLRAILVTSPHQGDGKTIIASNLAIAMAKTGRRTLLLDADMRNPSLHRIYSLENGVGLSSILSGESAPAKAVQASGIECLDVLTAGPVPHNPSELLNNRIFRKLLKDLAEGYDSVVIDAPPVGRFADALIVGAVCKATVLVMRAGKCTLKDGEESLEHLTAAGAAVLGVVVNDLAPRLRHYSSYASQYARKFRSRGGARIASASRIPIAAAVRGNGGGMQVLEAPAVEAIDNGNGAANGNGNGSEH
ncbi:MAG: polysaccharide biosynthesis tyrosine autokinase [Planctomycetota bacterium]|nr:polysaccharide biosynthesis tyrosine autokinase [Planctomycetota bacterium]